MEADEVMTFWKSFDDILAIAWHPRQVRICLILIIEQSKIAAVASKEGLISIINVQFNQTLKEVVTSKGRCVELKWNLGENMLLVTHLGGEIVLYNTDEERQVMDFEQQA